MVASALSHAHWQARVAPQQSTCCCPLTTCLGLIRYMWSERTPSCPCRMTEIICSSALAPSLQLPCCQGDPAVHMGPADLGLVSPHPVLLLTDEGAAELDSDTLERLGDSRRLASEVSGHTSSFPA